LKESRLKESRGGESSGRRHRVTAFEIAATNRGQIIFFETRPAARSIQAAGASLPA
jgi:hypothetical protein